LFYFVMPRLFLEYLSSKQLYQCKKCNNHYVDRKDLISKVGLRKTKRNGPIVQFILFIFSFIQYFDHFSCRIFKVKLERHIFWKSKFDIFLFTDEISDSCIEFATQKMIIFQVGTKFSKNSQSLFLIFVFLFIFLFWHFQKELLKKNKDGSIKISGSKILLFRAKKLNLIYSQII